MIDARPISVLRTGGTVQVEESATGAPLVCIDMSASSPVTLAVSWLEYDEHKSALILQAFEALLDQGIIAPAVKVLRFVDVGPTSGSGEERRETVRRHDAICVLARTLGLQAGFLISDAYLVPNGFRFDTLVFIER